MRFLVIVTLTFLMMALCGTYWSERQAYGTAQDKLTAQDWPGALPLLEQLSQSKWVFYDQRVIDFAREQAAAALLSHSLAGGDFARAGHLVNLILDGPRSGFEMDAQLIGAKLPGLHLDWAGRLLSKGKPDEALEECSIIRKLYGEQHPVASRVRRLEWHCQMALTRRYVRDGDLQGLLEVAGQLEGEEIPLPMHSEVEGLTLELVKGTADEYFDGYEYAGAYRLLGKAMMRLKECPRILQQLRNLQSNYDYALFGRRVGRPPKEITPAPTFGSSALYNRAQIRILNETGGPLRVFFRGPEKRELTLDSRGERTLELEAGQYVQFADAGARAEPFLGIVSIGEQEHRQVFTIRSGERQVSPGM